MSSEEEMEIRLTHLEDQVNRMNLVLAEQDKKVDRLISTLNRLSGRFKALEEGMDGGSGTENPFSPSEMPPDGINR